MEVSIIERARQVIQAEASALLTMAERIDDAFERAIELILASKGRVVVSGMGKSGLIGQKIASTFASTGTPAFFLHPAEGIHGDLGMIISGDVVIAISNSGETEELLRIIPSVKRIGASLITMCGNAKSTLVNLGDIFLDISVSEEACPLGLAPTSSTTATLAMGDAIAVALLVERQFKAEDFAVFHPGGALGKKLLLRVEDLMHSGSEIPLVTENALMKDVLFVISSKRLGVTGVTDDTGALVGVITDGDVRRALEKGDDILSLSARDVMKLNPRKITRTNLAAEALRTMEHNAITSLFVFTPNGAELVGIIHLHDLLKVGLA